MKKEINKREWDRNLILINRFRSPIPSRMTRVGKKLDISAFSIQSATAIILKETETRIYVPASFLNITYKTRAIIPYWINYNINLRMNFYPLAQLQPI